jgi:hypothetical protein
LWSGTSEVSDHFITLDGDRKLKREFFVQWGIIVSIAIENRLGSIRSIRYSPNGRPCHALSLLQNLVEHTESRLESELFDNI